MKKRIYIKGKKFNAIGEIELPSRKVTVFKGSMINPLETTIYGEKTTLLKAFLVRNGIIKNNVFTEHYTFDYPATASAIVSAGRPGYKIIKLVGTDMSIHSILKDR
jgi:hypothetical protein